MSETIKRGPGRPPKYANEEKNGNRNNAQFLKSRAKMEGKILLNEDEMNVILNEILLLTFRNCGSSTFRDEEER